jgi:hypothetical protein
VKDRTCSTKGTDEEDIQTIRGKSKEIGYHLGFLGIDVNWKHLLQDWSNGDKPAASIHSREFLE